MMNGFRFDEFGNVVKQNVYIVWGSPASGKTTYVRKHMSDGDLVVDLDLIKQAISMSDKTSTSDNLLSTAIAVRDTLYNLISERRVQCDNVWVIAGLPTREQREALRIRLNGELVYMEATKEQCIERAINDKERKDKDKQIYIINKWFKKFFYE
jgi:predicted kinase